MPLAPSTDDKNRDIVTQSAFALNVDYNVKATGYRGTATKNATSNVDFAVGAEDRYINGVHLVLKNHTWDDVVLNFQVVDADSLIPVPARGAFPSYPVLNEFGVNWQVDDEKQDQGANAFNYVARLPAGMYVRIVYQAAGTSLDVDVKLNCLLHKKVS